MLKEKLIVVPVVLLLMAHYNNAQGGDISPEDAEKIALTKVIGVVTEIERENEDGQDVYSVEIVKNDRKFAVLVHLKTGAVISVEGDDQNLLTK